MTKSKTRLEWERQDAAERAFMQTLEACKTLPWECGVYDPAAGKPVMIFASAMTEADAERYMQVRHERNGGVTPCRLTHQVGWWKKETL